MVQCIQYITCFLFVCIVLFLLLSFWCFVHTQTMCVQHIQFFPETTTWLSQFSREQVWKSSTQQLWISVSAVLYLGDDLCFRSKAEVRPCCQSTLHAFSYSQSILRVQYVPIARACQSWHISLYYSASATFLERISCLLETVKKKKKNQKQTGIISMWTGPHKCLPILYTRICGWTTAEILFSSRANVVSACFGKLLFLGSESHPIVALRANTLPFKCFCLPSLSLSSTSTCLPHLQFNQCSHARRHKQQPAEVESESDEEGRWLMALHALLRTD